MALTLVSYLSPGFASMYQHVGEQIAAQLGMSLDFKVGDSFDQFELEEADLVFACGFWYIRQPFNYEPIAAPVMVDSRYPDAPVYFVDLVTQAANKHIRTLKDLQGSSFGYNEEFSFSGYRAIMAEINRRGGEAAGFFGRLVKTGSHINSLKQLAQSSNETEITKIFECASIDSTVLDNELLEKPQLRKSLRLVESLGPYPAPPLLLNKRLSYQPELKKQIEEALIRLPSPKLRKLGVRRFSPVDKLFYIELAMLEKGLTNLIYDGRAN